jgi:hypothetical protein
MPRAVDLVDLGSRNEVWNGWGCVCVGSLDWRTTPHAKGPLLSSLEGQREQQPITSLPLPLSLLSLGINNVYKLCKNWDILQKKEKTIYMEKRKNF